MQPVFLRVRQAHGAPARVHILSDTTAKLAELHAMVGDCCPVTTELLGRPTIDHREHDALLVAVDLRRMDSICALKASLETAAGHVSKRVFIVGADSRLSIVQAYALGATTVLTAPVNRLRLISELVGASAPAQPVNETTAGVDGAAADAAGCFTSIFRAALSGASIDVNEAAQMSSAIADNISEFGLAAWLDSVRHHHEGTYQHCLLVTGIAVDFGLSLCLGKQDVNRLGLAAMFHDIGKATIPLSILDKAGRLDDAERELIKTHPVAGYDVLKAHPGISPEVLDAVRHHHEYLDGSGYPDGLGAESIRDLTRMLTIADVFAALVERRSYKPTMPREKAYEILQSMQDKLERPLVSAFRDVALTR